MTYFGDKAPNLAASIIALAVIAYITYGLRVYTRLSNGAWGLDDWSMTLATVSHPPFSYDRSHADIDSYSFPSQP